MRKGARSLEFSRSWKLKLGFLSGLFFLYSPIVALVLYSFNDSRVNVVWRGFTLKYYEKALGNAGLMEAMLNSLTIAFFSVLLSLALGILAAYCLWRYDFFAKSLFEGAMGIPIMIPEIAMGVAMMVFFNGVGWPTGWIWPFNLSAIVVAHVSFSFPFVVFLIRARLASFNREEEESAKDLGASPFRCFFDVTLPFMHPAVQSSAMLAFILSIDDFVVTFFTSTPDTATFPLKVYSMVRFSVTPEVNAVSSLLILTALLVVSAWTFFGRKGKRGEGFSV